MDDTYHWLDVERIAEELTDAHPETDPMSVRFPKLRDMVRALEGFEEQHGHPPNERILEAIQMAWMKEREEGYDIDEDEDEDG